MKRLLVVFLAVVWCGERSEAQQAFSPIRTMRVADRIEAYTPEGVFFGAFEVSKLATFYPVPTIIANSFLDSYDLARTDTASVGTGAWRARMATSADSTSRYLAIIWNVPPMTVPASVNADLRVPLWVTNRVRVAMSFFLDDVPVVNSGLDTVFASAGYQTHTLSFPSVSDSVNQVVLWLSYFYGEEGSCVLFFDQVVAAGGTVLEDGETGGGDTTPPGIPAAVTLTATSATSADAVATAPGNTDLASVVFEFDDDASFGSPLTVTAFASPGVQVTNTFIGLTQNTLYHLRAAARDTSGNQSAFSPVDTTRTFASVPGGQLPDPPTSFALTAASESTVVATFIHGVNATQTEVQLDEGSTVGSTYTGQVIAATPGIAGQVTFGGLRAERTYAGRARSLNPNGVSAYTATRTARTFDDTTPPAPVTDLIATALSATQVEVRFTIPSSSVDVTSAIVRWSVLSDFSVYHARQTSVWPGTAPRVTVSGLLPGTVYWFQVRLLDGGGNESNASNVDTARTPGGVTGVERWDEGIPSTFGLAQNFPNPFNPVTQIVYRVAERSRVKLTVYNVLGKEVAVLVDGEQSPGAYKATFDASSFPSGIYICRMEAGAFSATRKLVLLK